MLGPGWALLGDAGCSKDPFQALGMSDALRDADLLADAAHCGQRPLLEALHSVARLVRRSAAAPVS
jgi:flavin-dependent dehydrogenase